MKHYLAVLVPQAGGGWRAHFPDFPGCGGVGSSVEAALLVSRAAATKAAHAQQAEGHLLPSPISYEELRQHTNRWAQERKIDWSTAVVSLVPLHMQE